MNLRQWIESIVFAGLKPHGTRNNISPSNKTWLRRLLARIDKFLTGGPAPPDPLYLSNRTWGQKFRLWTLIGMPLGLFGLGILFALFKAVGTQHVKPTVELTPAEVAARSLPNLRDVKVAANHTLDVLEISIVRTGGLRMVGEVKNRTNHEIEHADISCDLADPTGTQLGSVNLPLDKIPASGTKRFEMPLQPTEAQSVLVREITTR